MLQQVTLYNLLNVVEAASAAAYLAQQTLAGLYSLVDNFQRIMLCIIGKPILSSICSIMKFFYKTTASMSILIKVKVMKICFIPLLSAKIQQQTKMQ